MKIEIAICTWNRAVLLKQTLESIASASIPEEDSLQVIVVNNNSTDETAQVAKAFEGRIPVTIVDEPKQGHCYSRNCAINHARGDLLLWTDDDVVIDEKWIVAYATAARSNNDESFWGGPILPVFESGKPKWITENWDKLSGCFAARDLGDQPAKLDHTTLPYGANFAIRTEVQKQFPFAEDLGRSGKSVIGDDELQMLRRVLESGKTGSWLPAAKLEHIIDSPPTTTDYVQRYFVGQGRVMASRGQQWHDDVVDLRREARHEHRMFLAKRMFAKSEVWVSHLLRGALAKGQALQLTKDK